MDAEKLITEVFLWECVWNQAHRDHYNRFVLEKKWEEIAGKLNTTKEAVKNKWKYLRDTFRKELAKCMKPRSGDAGGIMYEPKWPYYKSLLFLKDQFMPRKSTSNLQVLSCSDQVTLDTQTEGEIDSDLDTENHDTEDIEIQSAEEIDTDSRSNNLPSTPTSGTSNEPRVVLSRKKRKRSPDVIGQALLNVEREKLKLLKSKSNMPSTENKPLDEDRCFFESIIPHVHKMNPIKKLQFRTKIQELVMQYAYDYSESNNESSSNNMSHTLTTLDDTTKEGSFSFVQPWQSYE